MTWQVKDPADAATTIDLSSWRELLRIDKPEFNRWSPWSGESFSKSSDGVGTARGARESSAPSP